MEGFTSACSLAWSSWYANTHPLRPFAAQNDGSEQQGVRLSRSQIINKSIITRSSGINLGVASQVPAERLPRSAPPSNVTCDLGTDGGHVLRLPVLRPG